MLRCPHADDSLVVSADRDGNIFCPSCRPVLRADGHVYTGKKIWHAYQAYGKDKTIEKNQHWIEHLKERAAAQRKKVSHVSPATWKRLTGLD
jgi:uncharacterized Zn finger protein (UPF0148 family)